MKSLKIPMPDTCKHRMSFDDFIKAAKKAGDFMSSNGIAHIRVAASPLLLTVLLQLLNVKQHQHRQGQMAHQLKRIQKSTKNY